MRILHILRSPIGGLYRHVRDLASAQTKLGHDVGVVCSTEESPSISADLAALRPSLSLGLHRLTMQRLPHFEDLGVISNIREIAKRNAIDIVHGHGAKGGLYARLSGNTNVYTPHGGSLHYNWRELSGAAFLLTEKLLRQKTSGFIFVCDFEKSEFDRKINIANTPSRVVYNGLQAEDFAQVALRPGASQFLFVGEMRKLKGVDILLEAIYLLKPRVPDVSLTLVGDGQELDDFKGQANRLGITSNIQFAGRLNFAQALALGDTIVLPSRAESFPYVVLESIAANRTIIASDVGGISEILENSSLVLSGSPQALCDKLHDVIKRTPDFQERTATLRHGIQQKFTIFAMAEASLKFYQELH